MNSVANIGRILLRILAIEQMHANFHAERMYKIGKLLIRVKNNNHNTNIIIYCFFISQQSAVFSTTRRLVRYTQTVLPQ